MCLYVFVCAHVVLCFACMIYGSMHRIIQLRGCYARAAMPACPCPNGLAIGPTVFLCDACFMSAHFDATANAPVGLGKSKDLACAFVRVPLLGVWILVNSYYVAQQVTA